MAAAADAADNGMRYELIDITLEDNKYRCTFRPIDWRAFFETHLYYPTKFVIWLKAAIIDDGLEKGGVSGICADEAFYSAYCFGVVPIPCDTISKFNAVFKQYNNNCDVLSDNLFVSSSEITFHGIPFQNDAAILSVIYDVVSELFDNETPRPPLRHKRAVDDDDDI